MYLEHQQSQQGRGTTMAALRPSVGQQSQGWGFYARGAFKTCSSPALLDTRDSVLRYCLSLAFLKEFAPLPMPNG